MKINQEFFDYIEPALKEIREQTNDDYMIFGSAILYLLGIFEFNKNKFFHDIDVMVEREDSIPKAAAMIYFQGNKDRRLYKLFLSGFEVDFGGIWKETEDFFKRALKESIYINGYRFVSLDRLQEWKEMMGRPKDLKHVELIKKYKQSN